MLNVGVFDSKQRFLDGLRASFGGGTFLLGNKVSGTDIGAYISYLKNDYAEQERQRKFSGGRVHRVSRGKLLAPFF